MQRVSGFAQQGANVVWTMGHMSANVFQETYPFAKIAVYLTGTTTLATIFLDTNTPPTPLSNPFTADENGWWWFYVANGRYDIQIWPRTPVDLPWTIGDVSVYDTSNLDGIIGGILDPSSLLLDNGVCLPVTIQFDASCNLVFTNASGNILSVSPAGDVSAGALRTEANIHAGGNLTVDGCLYLSTAACVRSFCLDSTCNLVISDQNQNPLAWLSPQGALHTEGGLSTQGRIGVGLANPAYAVDVLGDVNITGQYRINGVPLGAAVDVGVSSLNTLKGDLTLVAGSNVTITPSGQVLIIAASAASGSQTPWLSAIDGNGQSLSNVGSISINNPSASCALTVAGNVCVTGNVDAASFTVNGQPLAALSPEAGWTKFDYNVLYVYGQTLVPLNWKTGLYRMNASVAAAPVLEFFLEFQSAVYINCAYNGGVEIQSLPLSVTPTPGVAQVSATVMMSPANTGGEPNILTAETVIFLNVTSIHMNWDMYENGVYIVAGSALVQ